MFTESRAHSCLATSLAVLVSAAVASCASPRPPRPTSLDPSNPAAPESQPLVATALSPGPGPPPAAPVPANEGRAAEAATPPAPGAGQRNDQMGSPPARHHNMAGEGGKAGKQPGTIYTCPMHPEVTSDKPGSCPKCGMRLVAKEPEGKK
jgi:hypothetical protein